MYIHMYTYMYIYIYMYIDTQLYSLVCYALKLITAQVLGSQDGGWYYYYYY